MIPVIGWHAFLSPAKAGSGEGYQDMVSLDRFQQGEANLLIHLFQAGNSFQ